ncbi:MAG: DNA-binding domain-containing protein [Dokdonella sp.]
MSALASLQKQFHEYVLHGNDNLVAAVVGTDSAPAQMRVNIYAQAYRLRLLEVLGNDYPGLRALSGDETFEQLLRDYIEHHPSPHYNVRWYGDRLADFLATSPAWIEHSAFAEMAAIEWDMSLVFDAPDGTVADVDSVAAIAPESWPSLRPYPQGALRIRPVIWNVAAIRRAADLEEELPLLARLDTPQQLVIWRRDRQVFYRAPEADEMTAFSAAADGATLADICEVLCEWHSPEVVVARAAAFLKRWVSDQWLAPLTGDLRPTV